MQYLKQIVTSLNDAVKVALADPRFQGGAYYGIAISAINENRLMPLITDDFDDEKWVGIDDTFPLIIYHKNNGISYVDEVIKSYGDNGHTSKRETTSFSMIVYGDRYKLRLTPEELEGAILSGFPSAIANSTLESLKIKSSIIVPVSSVLDPVIVYLAEYRTDKYELPPNTLLIRINYNIVSTYRTHCFDICNCNPVEEEALA